MPGADPAAIAIENADGQSHVGGDLDPNGAIGLDGRIAQNLPHAECRRAAESGTVDIANVVIGLRYRLFDPQESGGSIIRQRLCRIGLVLIIVGSTSFGSHPMIGNVVVIAGAVMVVTKEVLWRLGKAS